MTFKEFVKWCDQRTCDGCWGMNTAIVCIDILETVRKEPFWRREKIWKREFEDSVVNTIVKPIDRMIKEVHGE